MTTLNTSDLTDAPLAYFTGKALGYTMSEPSGGTVYAMGVYAEAFDPQHNPSHLLLILPRIATVLQQQTGDVVLWYARAKDFNQFANSPEMPAAVCRALILSVFGATVTLPAADTCDDLF